MFLFKNDVDFLHDSDYFKKDINRPCKECKKILVEQNEEFLESSENEQ